MLGDEAQYNTARKDLLRAIKSTTTATENFTESDVEAYDVTCGAVDRLLQQIRDKLEAYCALADALLAGIEDIDLSADGDGAIERKKKQSYCH